MSNTRIAVTVKTVGEIRGFSYPFSRTLLDHLKQLVEDEAVFETEADDDETTRRVFGEAVPVIHHLALQMKFNDFFLENGRSGRGRSSLGVCDSDRWDEPLATQAQVNRLINVTEKFLANFED